MSIRLMGGRACQSGQHIHAAGSGHGRALHGSQAGSFSNQQRLAPPRLTAWPWSDCPARLTAMSSLYIAISSATYRSTMQTCARGQGGHRRA